MKQMPLHSIVGIGCLVAATVSLLPAQVTVNLKSPDGTDRPYQLKPHPRLWLDGRDGQVTAIIRDPDGPGPRRSIRAQGPLWEALQRRLERLEPRASTNLVGNVALLAALGWFMDNNATYKSGLSYRQRALDHLNNVESVWVGLGACDKAARGCGLTDFAPSTSPSYMGNILSYWAQAYTLMRSEMTEAQRRAFAEKILNGITKDIAGGCENRLEQLPGVLWMANGGTVVLGAGSGTLWDKSMEGQWFYVKRVEDPFNVGMYIRPTRIVGQFMEVEKPASSSFFEKVLQIYRVKPWASGQCGMGFLANHHANTPTYVVAAGNSTTVAAMSSSSNILQVSSTNWIPKFLPFYVTVGGQTSGETMTVVAVSGNQLTVLRGQFSTQVSSWPAKTKIVFSSHTGDGDEMGWNNRTLTRQVGHIMAALALADDDPRAIDLLRTTLNYWYTNTWFAANNYFTISSTSATSYGLSRLVPFYLWSITSLYASTFPALDYRGEWIKRLGSDFYFYWSPPWDTKGLINWGIGAENCMSLNKTSEVQCAAPAAFLQGLYPGTQQAAFAWQWLNDQGIPQDVARLSADSGDRILVPLLLFTDPALPRQDHRLALLPHIVANRTDDDSLDATTNLSLISSKTDWTPQATQLYVLAADDRTVEFPSIPLSDKVVDSYNGDYGIGKQGWLLGQIHPDGYWMRFTGFQNVVDFGPAAHNAIVPGAELEIDRKKDGSASYLYTRIDLSKGYAPEHEVTRAYRYFVHFKAPGRTEHIVVYDDYASRRAQRIRGMLHYPNSGEAGEGKTTFDPGMTLVTSDNTKTQLLTKIVKVSGSGIRTDLNVAWEDNTAVIGTYCTFANPCRAAIGGWSYVFTSPATVQALPAASGKSEVYIWLDPLDGRVRAAPNNASISCSFGVECRSAAADFPAGVLRLARMTWNAGRVAADCPGGVTGPRALEFDQCVGGSERHLFMDAGPSVTDAEFLVVHKASALNEPMEPVTELNTGGFYGVQIGGKDPKIALFARQGLSYSSVQGETTHEGVAQYLISGLAPGSYEIRAGNTVLASGVPVTAGEGALYFESAKGLITISRIGVPFPLRMTVNRFMRGQAGASFAEDLHAEGGTPPYRWSVSAGALPAGLFLSNSTSSLNGLPAETGSYAFLVTVTDSDKKTATVPVRLVVGEEDSRLRITSERLGDALFRKPYFATLGASGGTAPYHWTLLEGDLPKGLTLDSASGEIHGLPGETGEFSFTILAEDRAGAAIERTFVLEVVLKE